ncbi:hypothetical protein RU07_01685 [Agrobacterium tumefaciens]|uniref:Uncharacterized protein n=1 Tax=Agrobacterium tumefaciens TaxID=358 RepID=A0A0D0JHR8_AGRTU|nr:hypothetical protein RU07_01685 [Agrobacterium tumefaciens]
MSPTPPHNCSPDDIRRALTILMPPIEPYWQKPLKDYAVAAYDLQRQPASSVARGQAMLLVRSMVERVAQKAGFGLDDARSASFELTASPVLQTGPHTLLLFEPDAFYTHLFSLMGLQSSGRRWHVTYAGSTMSFKESAKKGPGWLRLEGEPLNLFGLPRSQMDGRSICCFNGTYRFLLSNSAGVETPNNAAKRLLEELPPTLFPSASEAIKAANKKLWSSHFGRSVNLLQLDDFDVAGLIAEHLEDPTSWLYEFFVAERHAALLPNGIDRLNAGLWRGWVRRTTDYFWYVGPEKVLPVVLDGGYLRGVASSDVMVKFAPDSIASAIRDRKLLPTLFLAFLVLSIVPGIRALGGCRQPVYLPLLRYLAALCAERSGDGDLLNDLRQDDYPGMWGHRVLRPSAGDPFHDINGSGGISALIEDYGSLPLFEASGDLTSFTGDTLWSEMSKHLASGEIKVSAAEWKWSGV